ncbi:hypothetical protein HPP92_006655 [Vanilla planifolia]|uniref:Uncharacterized protein n=1 Tax=Vanilla planifolia TaxID=51239 RepID=A0A835V870_VANPL|nr:hypothetical protein HPP92_006919 [Vanilla planifolia]KAG0489792.1 hypothetical protein HPP92_006655 [Vanilla planifolia]
MEPGVTVGARHRHSWATSLRASPSSRIMAGSDTRAGAAGGSAPAGAVAESSMA